MAIAFLLVVAGSGTDGDDGERASETSERTSTEETTERKPAPRRAATYTVKTGDTLGAIAEKTGLDVETLQQLNPGARPAGARVRSEDQAAGVTEGSPGPAGR